MIVNSLVTSCNTHFLSLWCNRSVNSINLGWASCLNPWITQQQPKEDKSSKWRYSVAFGNCGTITMMNLFMGRRGKRRRKKQDLIQPFWPGAVPVPALKVMSLFLVPWIKTDTAWLAIYLFTLALRNGVLEGYLTWKLTKLPAKSFQ